MGEELLVKDGRKAELVVSQLIDKLKQDDRFHLKLTPAELTTQLVAIYRLAELARGSRPGPSSPDRPVYDKAISSWDDKQNAINALEAAFADGVSNLYERLVQARKTGTKLELGPDVKDLSAVLVTVRANMAAQDAYTGCDPGHVADLSRFLKDAARPDFTAVERSAASQILPMFIEPIYVPGAVRLIQEKGSDDIHFTAAKVTDDLLSVFRAGKNDTAAAKNAQEFLDSLILVVSDGFNGKFDKNHIQRLLDAMSKIPENKSIRQSPEFQAAQDALKKGDGKAFLDAFAKITSLSTFRDTLKLSTIVSVSNRAVTIFDTSVLMRINIGDNMGDLRNWIEQGANEKDTWAHFSLLMRYSRMLISGQVQQGTFDLATQKSTPTSTSRITGTGDLYELTPQFGFYKTLFGIDTEINLFATVGHQKTEMQPIELKMQDGSTKNLNIGSEGFYIGFYGAEIKRRLKSDTNRMRWYDYIDRIGTSAVGSPTNVYAWLGLRFPTIKKDRLAADIFFTPEYSRFLDTSRFGAEAKGTMLYKPSSDWTLYVTPRVKGVVGSQGIGTLEGSLNVGAKYKYLGMEVGGGYVGEVGGESYQRLPATPTFSVRFILSPPEKRSLDETVPVKEASSPLDIIAGAYVAALELSDDRTVGDTRRAEVAKQIAGRIEGQAMTMFKLKNQAQYLDGIQHLRAGRLKDGLSTLRFLPEFRQLEAKGRAKG